MKEQWLSQATGCGGQALIYSEKDGRNIAVVYDEKDAPGIVRAVNAHDELVRAIDTALVLLEEHQGEAPWYLKGHYNGLTNALAKAKG